MKKPQFHTLVYFVFLIVLSFLAFYRLGDFSLRKWDESRNATNALEMYYNHNYVVRYFMKMPDMYETKPPLLTWLQVLSFKIFGVSELSLRIPSALALIATCLLICWFVRKKTNNIFAGIFSGLILATSTAYITFHGARTGDHESLLVFFTTGLIISFYLYLNDANRKYILIAMLCLIGGTLTKSIAPLLFIPGLLLFTALSRNLKKVLIDKYFWISVSIYIVVISGYYISREMQNPGYCQAVWLQELGPRYVMTNENLSQSGFFYYIIQLFKGQLSYWPLLFVILVFPALRFTKTATLTKFIMLQIVVFLIIISIGNKNLWYDYPLAPLFAIVCGLGISALLLNSKESWKPLIISMMFLTMIYPVSIVVEKINSQTINDEAVLQYPDFVRSLRDTELAELHIKVMDHNQTPNFRFYEILSNKIWKINVDFKVDEKDIKEGDYIMTSFKELESILKPKFTCQEMKTYRDCVLVRVE